MNVLVTGGAGYIGSHCVKALLDAGHTVTIIDNFSTGYVQAVDERAKLYNADIKNFYKVMSILINNDIEAVIHFAAFSLVGESMKVPLKYYENNVYGTKVLLDAMAEADVKKIVFSSTAAVYGAQEVMPITEEALEAPTNAYGETKLAMEKMMKWSDVAYGMKYVALRYFNVAGAHHTGDIGESHNPETHLIPLILQVPLGKREHISIFGSDYNTPDGTCVRDYIHIEDLINAHMLALDFLDKGNDSNYFNLGSGEGYSVLQMIEAAREVTGHKIPAKMEARRAGDPDALIASSAKAMEVLGWERKYTDVKDIIGSAWKFHQNFKEGFKK